MGCLRNTVETWQKQVSWGRGRGQCKPLSPAEPRSQAVVEGQPCSLLLISDQDSGMLPCASTSLPKSIVRWAHWERGVGGTTWEEQNGKCDSHFCASGAPDIDPQVTAGKEKRNTKFRSSSVSSLFKNTGKENELQKVLKCGMSRAGGQKGEHMRLSRGIQTFQLAKREIWWQRPHPQANFPSISHSCWLVATGARGCCLLGSKSSTLQASLSVGTQVLSHPGLGMDGDWEAFRSFIPL